MQTPNEISLSPLQQKVCICLSLTFSKNWLAGADISVLGYHHPDVESFLPVHRLLDESVVALNKALRLRPLH